MKSITNFLKPKFVPRPSLAVRTRDWLTVLAILAGGAWAATEFFWDRVIAPRMEPTLVQGEIDHKIVGESECCVFSEAKLRFTNVGKRSAFLVTSNFVVGARSMKLAIGQPGSGQDGENDRVLEERAILVPSGLRAAEFPLHFGTAIPTSSTFNVLVTGDVLRSNTVLEPKESVNRQITLLVPKNLPFVSLRATLVIAHTPKASPETLWSWSSDASTLASQVMPWPKNDFAKMKQARDCALGAPNPSDALNCNQEAMNQARRIWAAMKKTDRHSYTAPYAYDFIAVASGRPDVRVARN